MYVGRRTGEGTLVWVGLPHVAKSFTVSLFCTCHAVAGKDGLYLELGRVTDGGGTVEETNKDKRKACARQAVDPRPTLGYHSSTSEGRLDRTLLHTAGWWSRPSACGVKHCDVNPYLPLLN